MLIIMGFCDWQEVQNLVLYLVSIILNRVQNLEILSHESE